MSVERIARDFVKLMNDPETVKEYLTADALVSGGMLLKPEPATEALKFIGALKDAMPDLKYNIYQVRITGDQVTVKTQWSGTQTAALSLPMPGMPTFPPTGKKVSVKDTFVITVKDDKVSHLHINSPADGGVLTALTQLGITMPTP